MFRPKVLTHAAGPIDKRRVLWLIMLALCLGLFAESRAQPIEIEMTCFPPPPQAGAEPGIGPPPPCLLPAGLDPKFVSPNPSGMARINVKGNGRTTVDIRLDGLASDLVITAWVAYFFPPGPTPHPIFDPIGEGMPPVAGLSVPLAPTGAAFTEGLGTDPNRFEINPHGMGRLRVELDYNLFQAGQGPLRNELIYTHQAHAPAGSGAEQPLCCPEGLPAPRPQPVGGSYLRVFDPETGFQVLDADGRPELLRSPVPAVVIALVVHIDETTHGLNAGIPIRPAPGVSAQTGDHYTLGLFDLRAFHEGADQALSTGTQSLNAELPAGFVLSEAYPNPFNPQTQFTLLMAQAQPVRVEVFDTLGRRVALLHEGVLEGGVAYRFTFDGAQLPSGLYVIRAEGRAGTSTRAVMLVH